MKGDLDPENNRIRPWLPPRLCSCQSSIEVVIPLSRVYNEGLILLFPIVNYWKYISYPLCITHTVCYRYQWKKKKNNPWNEIINFLFIFIYFFFLHSKLFLSIFVLLFSSKRIRLKYRKWYKARNKFDKLIFLSTIQIMWKFLIMNYLFLDNILLFYIVFFNI